MTEPSVPQIYPHIHDIHTIFKNQNFCPIQFRWFLFSSNSQVTFGELSLSKTKWWVITIIIKHLHLDQIKIDIRSMFDFSKQQLHSYVGL